MRTAEEIREEFTKLTGVTPDNSQGEPDIEYVWWLENRLREAECTLPVVSGSLPLASDVYPEQILKDEFEQAMKRKNQDYAEGYVEGIQDGVKYILRALGSNDR